MDDFRFYIKVLAGPRQGERIEIPRSDQGTGHCAQIYEDEEICFMLISSAETENPILWISDLPKPPSDFKRLSQKVIWLWHPESRGFNRYQAFFLNCFGTCRIAIEVRADTGEPQWIELRPFEVLARKITGDRLREIIKYLASRMADLPGASFSVTRIAAGQRKRNATTLLKEAEDGLNLFEKQLPILLAQHRTRLAPKRIVHTPGPGDYFDANTAEWLLSHPDMLIPASESPDAVAVIDSRPFTVDRLEVSELFENSNVYENQVLHSFLHNLRTFLAETLAACNRIEAGSGSRSSSPGDWNPAPADFSSGTKPEGITPHTGGYVSFSTEIRTSVRELFKGRKVKCEQLLLKCNYLMRVLEERIPVKRLLFGAPSLTPWVKANAHYRVLFERIIKWYHRGATDWSDEETLAGVRSIDELYEYFCLYKIMDALEKSGFLREEKAGETGSYNILRGRYDFIREQTRVTLYYEKEIWSPKHRGADNEKYFNVEGWIWENFRRKGAHAKRVPDYILEISRDGEEETESESVLAVFDAKYSPRDTVFFEKLPMLVMRYVHGISGKSGGVSPVAALYLFHPKESDHDTEAAVRSFYTSEYDVFGDKAVIPALGTAELDPASRWDISVLINRIVELAELMLDG